MEILAEVISDLLVALKRGAIRNTNTFATLLVIACPYISMLAVISAYRSRGYFGVGSEWFVPLVFLIVACILRSVANKTGNGLDVPVPKRRFTNIEDDGEITIDADRSEELILYMADIEDWLERRRLM